MRTTPSTSITFVLGAAHALSLLLGAACGAGERSAGELRAGTRADVLVTAPAGFYFYPPLAAEPVHSGSFAPGRAAELAVILERADASGVVSTVGVFDSGSAPRLSEKIVSERYFVNLRAADYFVDRASAYTIRVLFRGAEIATADVPALIFDVIDQSPLFMLGVAFRLETGAIDRDGDGVLDGDDHCPDLADPANPVPTPEACDGLDNDCDGQSDEGNPGSGISCAGELPGLCASGTTTCSNGSLVCVPAFTPAPEICGNGLDEDCDGLADDGCTVPLPGAIASITHVAINGEGDRDGNGYPPTNMFDGDLSTFSRYRTGVSIGFRIEITLAAPSTVSGLRIHVPAETTAGYAGIRISTSTDGAYSVQYTDTRLFGRSGRSAGSNYIGGVTFGPNHVGVQGTFDHLFAPVAGVRSILIETGWNDEASDACYSMYEVTILGQ